MPFRTPELCLCAVALFFSLSSGQNAASVPAAQQTPPAAIRTSANLVLIDVVATDRGKAVQGLKAGEFHVFENGKEQRISVFEEHRASDAPEIPHVSAALPPNTYSDSPPYSLTSAADVLLLDALNTPTADQLYVRQQMMQYVKHVPTGTRIAVFTLASRLRMIEGFTTDAAAVGRAVTGGNGTPQQSPLLDSTENQDALSDVASSMSGVDSGQMQQFLADTQSFQTDQRVSLTLDALAQLGRYLSTVPGRKNLVWFSGSFPLQIDPDATQGPGRTPNGAASPVDPFSPMRSYSQQVKETDSLLTAARVAVYPIDARGLMNLASSDAGRSSTSSAATPQTGSSGSRRKGGGGMGSASSGSGQSTAQKADAAFLRQTASEHQTMNQIADETGGKAFYDDNGLAADVAAAISSGSSYFTLGYVPDMKAWDGAFRSIQVHVDGGKYDLAYRRGYYAVDPTKPGPESPGTVSPIVAALQRGASPLSQLIFEARVLAADDPAAKDVKVVAGPAGELTNSLKPPVHRYLVDFALDPHAVTWSALPNGGAHAEIEVSMVAWDADGHRVNYTDRAYSANLDLAESQKVLSGGLPIHQEIDLPSGALYLRVALHDLRNGRIGSMEIPLRVSKN